MPRQSLSPVDRSSAVVNAAGSLSAAIQHALNVSADLGYDHADALQAWEIVETAGATIHRQSRLLAGKSRGG